MTQWLIDRKQGEDIEEISPHQEIIDSVLEYINSCVVYNGIGEEMMGVVYWKDNSILVQSNTIKNLAAKIDRNIKLRKITDILGEYLNGNTQQYRLSHGGRIRMWCFDPGKLGITQQQVIEPGEENES